MFDMLTSLVDASKDHRTLPTLAAFVKCRLQGNVLGSAKTTEVYIQEHYSPRVLLRKSILRINQRIYKRQISQAVQLGWYVFFAKPYNLTMVWIRTNFRSGRKTRN